jgi:uncharacterized damage-inducible protein DinB
MYTSEALLDLHERSHRNLNKMLEHCSQLNEEELNREIPGFGYPSVRLQLHHEIGAQEYWIGVLNGEIRFDDNDADYPTIESLEAYRNKVYRLTEEYLHSASSVELNTERLMKTWDDKEHMLVPARVFIRTMTHIYYHNGQIYAMCKQMGKPAPGTDFPIM